MEAKTLFLSNDNNRLLCDAFNQIHFAPEKPITETELSRLYVVRVNNEDVFLKMLGLVRLPFIQISSVITLPASGKESDEWRRDFLKLFPNTKDDTPMAVYMYQRLKADL